MKFKEFLEKLQKEEGESHPLDFIANWRKNHKREIINKLRQIPRIRFSIPRGTTPQAFGNLAAKRLFSALPANSRFQRTSKKAGYPDWFFKTNNSRIIAVELKATTEGRDSQEGGNRSVLFSATNRLRALFELNNRRPLAHCVVISVWSHGPPSRITTLRELRLHFLKRSSEVNVRLECSSTNELYNKYDHVRIAI